MNEKEKKDFIRHYIIHHGDDDELVNAMRADLIQHIKDSAEALEYFETWLNYFKRDELQNLFVKVNQNEYSTFNQKVMKS